MSKKRLEKAVGMVNLSNKQIIGSVMVLLLIFGIGVRIWYVNKDLEVQKIETYAMGEEVALENNIFFDENEDMSDYSITVKNAEIVTYEEFLDKYQYKENDDDPLFEDDDMTFPEMIYDIDVIVRNVNKEENLQSGMSFLDYWLINSDLQLQTSSLLYEIANPSLPDGTMQFTLRPDTEMEFHLPFYFQPTSNYNPVSVEEVRNGNLRLVVSLYPVQKEIIIEETNCT